MIQRTLLCFIALFGAVVFSAHAEENSSPLPPHVAAHVSVRSPLGLLASVDTYAAAATKGTPQEVPPGILMMLAQMQRPAFLGSVDLEKEAHIVVSASDLTMLEDGDDFLENIELDGMVFVFSVSDFDELVSAFEEEGISGKLVDLGEGRVAFGRDEEAVQRVLGDWTPRHESDANLTIRASMANLDGKLSDAILGMLEEGAEDIVAEIIGAGVKTEAAEGVMAVINEILPQIIDEIDSMPDALLELSVAGNDILIDVGAKPEDGSFLSEAAEQLADAPALDATLFRSLPAGAGGIFAMASLPDMIPDAEARLTRFSSAIYGEIMPEFKDRAEALAADYMDSGHGKTVAGIYAGTGSQYSLALYGAADPEKAMKAVMDGMTLFNEFCAALMDDPSESGMSVEGGMVTEGDVTYYAARFAYPESITKEFEGVLDNIRFFLAPMEGGIVTASGKLTDAEFLARLAETASASGGAPTAPGFEKAAKLLADLPNAQAALYTLDAAYFLDMVASQRLAMPETGESPPDGAVAKFIAERKKGDAFIVFGAGAEAGWLTGRAVLPADAVKQILRDAEAFSKATRRTPPAVEEESGNAEEPEEAEEGEDDPAAA